MPAAIPIIIGWVLTAIEIDAWIVAVAVMAASYAVSELTKEKGSSLNPSMARKAQTTTMRSGVVSQQVIYGETQVGGVLVYLDSSGVDEEYAHMVVAMAPHECESIGDIYFDDKLATEFPSSHYRINKHLGSTDQLADADLIAECTGLDASFRLRGIAYVYVRFKFDRDVWVQGLPRNIKAIIKGKKLYDPREITHDPADSSTWAWSDNWALVMRDFITGSYGMDATLEEVDDDNVIAAANTSEEQVINYGGTYHDRYTVNGTIDTADNLAANRDSLAQAGGGYAPWVEGKIKLMPGVYTPPVSRALTDDDLRDKISIRPRTPHQDIFNAVKGVYMGPGTNYQTTEFPPVTNAFYKEQDGGEEIFADIELPYCDDPDRAQRLSKMLLDRARQPIIVNFPGKWTCFSYTVGDTISLTLTAGRATPIFDTKEFRIIKWSLAANGDGVDLVLQEEASGSYDWNQGDAVWYDTAPDTNLPSIFTPPPNVVNVVVTETVYDFRLVSKTKITVNFDPPPGYPYFSHIEVQHCTDGVNFVQMADQKSSFEIDPVSEGDTHYFRLKSVSTAGVRTEDSQAYLSSHTVVGQNTEPASLSALSAIVNGSTINLYSTKLNDPDIEVYEFRLGAFFSGIFLSSQRSPNLSLSGVKPGNYTFSVNTLSTNGLYGSYPQTAYASLSDPPGGWTVIATQSYDYSTGTFDNTEATVYDASPYLKCSHTLGVLSGKYTTPIYDIGSVAERLFYALADVVITGTGTTWNSKFAVGATWNELGIDALSWREIFELSEAPQIKMALLYGETSPPTFRAEKMEILSTVVTARYFQLEIEITDPIAGMNALVEAVQLKFATR
ncbi:MAG: phage tail protein [Spirochaetales bacterium]|jgi:hypothetical protein|nr:phage tail protein [Spirochaetales bacterium]